MSGPNVAIILSISLCCAVPVQENDVHDLPTFLQAYAPYEARLIDVYRHIQIVAESLELRPKGDHKRIQEYQIFLANGELQRSEIFDPDRTYEMIQRCHLLNPEMGSYYCKREQAEDKYVIDGQLSTKEMSSLIASRSPLSIAPFGFYGVTIREYLQDPGLQFISFKEETSHADPRLVLRISYDYSGELQQGRFEFDPAGNWTLTGFELANGNMTGQLEYEGAHQDVPLIRHAVYERKDPDGGLHERRTLEVREITPKAPDVERFLVSDLAIDYIPPPMARRRPSIWWWLLGASALLIGIGVYWAQRR